jgi:dipeptidyl aminopeptidase/acylaminoacyl peptidase
VNPMPAISGAFLAPAAGLSTSSSDLSIYDFSTRQEHRVNITVVGDFPEIRPHFLKLDSKRLSSGAISPNGARAVFEGHGDILTDLGKPSSYFYSPVWSPDSKRIAFTDKFLHLWYIDVDKGAKFLVDTNSFDRSQTDMNPRWSPDSQVPQLPRTQSHAG